MRIDLYAKRGFGSMESEERKAASSFPYML
jgi:hypothetical protein